MKLIKFATPLMLVSILFACSTQSTQVTQAVSTQYKATQQDTTNAKIEYAFTQAKQHPEKLLENVIDNSKQTLDIAIYSLSKDDIVDSIIKAKQRGVNVRVITDRTEAKTKNQSEDLQKLIQAGIPVKQNHHSGLMHMKVTIADKSVLTTGSFNYSQAASFVNDENIVIIYDSNMASEWDKEFETMWNDIKNFEDVK